MPGASGRERDCRDNVGRVARSPGKEEEMAERTLGVMETSPAGRHHVSSGKHIHNVCKLKRTTL